MESSNTLAETISWLLTDVRGVVVNLDPTEADKGRMIACCLGEILSTVDENVDAFLVSLVADCFGGNVGPSGLDGKLLDGDDELFGVLEDSTF